MSICSRFKPSTERHPCLVFNPGPQVAQFPSTPTPNLSLFSLSDRLIHTLAPPFPSVCVGAGQGWLVLSDRVPDLSLFNPLTKEHLRNLPTLSSLDHLTPVHDPTTLRISAYSFKPHALGETSQIPPPLLTGRLLARALVVPNPAEGGELAVVLLMSLPFRSLAWAKPGDERWTTVDGSLGFLDLICHKDQIFTVMCSGAVCGWGAGKFIPITPQMADAKFVADDLKERRELNNADKQARISSRNISFFLASSPSGDLLRVRKERITGTKRWRMKVHKVMVDAESKSPKKLIELKHLGENAILLGGSTAICVSTVGAPELKRNRIYFAEGSMDGPWTEAGIYSVEDGSIEPLLPSMMPPYPRPSWIVISHA